MYLLESKAWCNYIFDLLYISNVFFPERSHWGNQTVICNITLSVCISFPNSLGGKYVQQIAFGNINKDCHSRLHLQDWQTEKEHTFSLILFAGLTFVCWRWHEYQHQGLLKIASDCCNLLVYRMTAMADMADMSTWMLNQPLILLNEVHYLSDISFLLNWVLRQSNTFSSTIVIEQCNKLGINTIAGKPSIKDT